MRHRLGSSSFLLSPYLSTNSCVFLVAVHHLSFSVGSLLVCFSHRGTAHCERRFFRRAWRLWQSRQHSVPPNFSMIALRDVDPAGVRIHAPGRQLDLQLDLLVDLHVSGSLVPSSCGPTCFSFALLSLITHDVNFTSSMPVRSQRSSSRTLRMILVFLHTVLANDHVFARLCPALLPQRLQRGQFARKWHSPESRLSQCPTS